MKLRLSLEQAVRLGLSSAERIGASRAGHERADGAVLEAYSGILPLVAATGSLTRSKTEVQTVGGVRTPADPYANLYSGTVQLTQPLFTGGAVYYGVKAARERRAAAGEDVRAAQQTTIFTVAQGYYSAVLAREELIVVRGSYDLAKRHFEDVQARERAGTASKFDVLRAKVAMQNQETQVISAENSASLAMAALLRETGLPQNSRVELVTDFNTEGVAPRSIEESIRTAMAKRPEMASAMLASRAQRDSVGAARSGYLPKVSGTASWGGTSTEDPTADDHLTEAGRIGVQVQWNLFDGALTRARVAEARADLSRYEWQERGLRSDIELQVRQAVLRLENARALLDSQGANVQEAAEAFRLAEARQKAGAGTELDVQDARNAWEQAKLSQVRARSQYAVARLTLDQATGVLESSWRKP
ncbi:MAG TPA: TolC family protein [Planctomycetota bacterium]|nr:TolC family protein [Planctomycetota bacterium]